MSGADRLQQLEWDAFVLANAFQVGLVALIGGFEPAERQFDLLAIALDFGQRGFDLRADLIAEETANF